MSNPDVEELRKYNREAEQRACNHLETTRMAGCTVCGKWLTIREQLAVFYERGYYRAFKETE